jgi:hypothetical protein
LTTKSHFDGGGMTRDEIAAHNPPPEHVRDDLAAAPSEETPLDGTGHGPARGAGTAVEEVVAASANAGDFSPVCPVIPYYIADRHAEEVDRKTAEVAALRAEVEKLKADAERYRWLRANSSLSFSISKSEIWTGGYYPNDLDAAIDAARKEES